MTIMEAGWQLSSTVAQCLVETMDITFEPLARPLPCMVDVKHVEIRQDLVMSMM
jgi:hypothetical protein